ncbi:MAG: hypothetical protein ACLPWF_24470 [Bryobacteraceae bacterium]
MNVTAADIVAGAIDWRFADPSADTLVGFHGKTLAAEPLARKAIAQLGARLGLTPTEVDNVLERLIGSAAGGDLGRPKPDRRYGHRTWKRFSTAPARSALEATPVAGNAMLVGPAEAVTALVKPTRYLPVRESAAVPTLAKPVIHGLD